MFTKAIVRRPSASMVKGLTQANLGQPNFKKAQIQHSSYIKALESCGLEVTILDELDDFPDGVFVEDVALCTPCGAILTRPGAPSRRAEAPHIKAALSEHYPDIARINDPGTLEAGDIMMVGDRYYIGRSARSNFEGNQQCIHWLAGMGYKGVSVPLKDYLHLKTGLSYLENNHLLITGEFVDNPIFKDFTKLIVDPDEEYAANSVWINGTVLSPKGFPKTKKLIESAGYPLLEVDVSEFQKLDGGLSCLSLRF